MAEPESTRSDPLNDVINLLAAPLATGVRSFEQVRKGFDELFRTIDNLNTTLENLNEAASRVNRLMADVEEPIRAMVPQLTRTIKMADDFMETVGAPAMRAAPNIGRVVDTLSSPAFVALPQRLDEFITVIGDATRRLGPLTQLAESAGGLFGFRLPGSSGPSTSPPSEKPATKQPATKKPAMKRAAAKRAPSKKSAAKKTAARKTAARKAGPQHS